MELTFLVLVWKNCFCSLSDHVTGLPYFLFLSFWRQKSSDKCSWIYLLQSDIRDNIHSWIIQWGNILITFILLVFYFYAYPFCKYRKNSID